MSLLSIKHIFGIRTSVPYSIVYLNEHCYLYPSNRHIILYNTDYKSQYSINYENEYDRLECLAVSSNREYLAIALNTLTKCRIILYTINQRTNIPVKRKILSSKQTLYSHQILSLVFSPNSKYLLAFYGAPDFILVSWSIQQLKTTGNISLHINLSLNPLHLQISFNPFDSSQILLTGNQIFREYYFNNGRFSTNNQDEFHRHQSMHITCHCWLNDSHILLGLDNGFMCTVNKHGHIIQHYNVTRVDDSNNILYGLSSSQSEPDFQITNEKNLSKLQSTFQLSSISINHKRALSAIDLTRRRYSSRHLNATLDDISTKTHLNHPNAIMCLLPFSRGIFLSTATGCVFMYERSENSIELTFLRRLILPSSTFNDLSLSTAYGNPKRNISKGSTEDILFSRSSFRHQTSIGTEVIHSLALSPNEETLLAGTNHNHLYEITFSKMDYRKKEANTFTHALASAHHGSIRSGVLCIRKALLFTIGTDRCLKIWNLQTNYEELSEQFANEPSLITVHPSGLFICISFSHLLIIYGYTIDGLVLFKQSEIFHIQCERQQINERIDGLEELKDACNENAEIELRNVHYYYATKLQITVDQIEKLENEEVLLNTRLEQLEDESVRYENQIKEYSNERNDLIVDIRQIDNDLNSAAQIFQQRHFIIQEKVKRTNEMENRRDELEKFAYVFNYKIRELTSQIGPRQYEVQALIEQFNNMDNEYDLLSQNNEKYSIKIADYQARLRAIEKDLQKETSLIRKLNEISENIKEDFKLSSHLIDQPKQLTRMIRKIYEKYILYVHTNINFGQMNIFDCDRQRTYFERTNRRLQRKISIDIQKEKIEETHRMKEQLSMMREISSYCLKVVEVERILSDLDIVSNLAHEINARSSSEIIQALKAEHNSKFIQKKQMEFHSLLNKQQKRIEQLREFLQKLEQHLQQTSHCDIPFVHNPHSNSSTDQSRIISFDLNH